MSRECDKNNEMVAGFATLKEYNPRTGTKAVFLFLFAFILGTANGLLFDHSKVCWVGEKCCKAVCSTTKNNDGSCCEEKRDACCGKEYCECCKCVNCKKK